MIKLRKAVEKLLELVPENDAVFFIAPTGYGKTLSSPLVLEESLKAGKSAGLIQIAPLKTLVRKIFEEKFSKTRFKTGYQSQDAFETNDKTPFFMRELVITTLDSFVLNTYKMPVAELNKILRDKTAGHYYTPLSFILTSTIVFDEAHVYTGGVDESISISLVHAGISYLSALKTPIIVETATMNSRIIETLAKVIVKSRGEAGFRVPVLYVSCGGENKQIEKLSKTPSLSLERVNDDEYCRSNDIKWRTELVKSEEKLPEIVAKHAGDGRVVLIVRNTVEKALATFKSINEKTGVNTTLIHGRMSVRDREASLSRMDAIMKNGGVVVATQVIEAGVETNASVLITDPAPIENLVQRAGRLCREGSIVYKTCLDEGGYVYLINTSIDQSKERYDVYSTERVIQTLSEVKQALERKVEIDWRLPDSFDNKMSFTEIIEKVEPPMSRDTPDQDKVTSLFLNYLKSEGSSDVLKELADRLGLYNFLRESVQLNLAILPLKGIRDGAKIEIDPDTISVDADWFLSREGHRIKQGGVTCLEYDNNHVLIARREYSQKPLLRVARSMMLTRSFIEQISSSFNRRGVSNLISFWKIPYVYTDYKGEEYQYLILKHECYKKGEGLLID